MSEGELKYLLPRSAVAQSPAARRDRARLLVLDRESGARHDTRFYRIGEYLRAGDLLVVNDSDVQPLRLHATRPTGGRVELLLLRSYALGAVPPGREEWEALGRGRVREGEQLHGAGGNVEITGCLGSGRYRVQLKKKSQRLLRRYGRMPLPPYIDRSPEDRSPERRDRRRYRTVYAASPGSVAAPTAGLHFTALLLQNLLSRGIEVARATLHIGPATFLPPGRALDPEWYQVPAETIKAVRGAQAEGRRVVAVGTSTVRALESAALAGWPVGPSQTDLVIRPGFRFRSIDALVTNFHLPESSLLALVAAFAGWERILEAYRYALQAGYRFLSYGDAMLIR